MNFSQQISAAYKIFVKEKDITLQGVSNLALIEDEFEDLLFSTPSIKKKFAQTLRYNYNEVPEVVKRYNKEAKAYVRDHPVHQKKEDNFSFEMTEQLALSLSNANTEEAQYEKKKKLSPRSNQRA